MIIKKINNPDEWSNELNSFTEYSPYMYYDFCKINNFYNWQSVWIKVKLDNKKILIYFKYKKILNFGFFWCPQSILGDLTLLNAIKIKDFLKNEVNINYIYLRINLPNEKNIHSQSIVKSNYWKLPFKKLLNSSKTVIINPYYDNNELKSKISKNFYRTVKKSTNEYNKSFKIISLKNLDINKVKELQKDFKKIKTIDDTYLNKLRYLKNNCGDKFLVGYIEKNKKIISLRIVFIGKKISLDFINLTNEIGRMNLSNYFITNELLKYIFNKRIANKFDFSGIDEVKNNDVAKFKLGFSGKVSFSSLGEYDYCNNIFINLIVSFILFFYTV